MREELIITNVSALVSTGIDFDIFQISQKMSNSNYNPRKLAAVVIRKQKPKSTFLLFKSGKIMVLGTQSEKDAEMALRKLCKQLQKVCGVKIKKFEFRITNIFGTVQLNHEVNLAQLCDIGGGIQLESFPGVFYQMKQHIKAATIYSSGKITLIGAKSRENLQKAALFLEKKLKNFAKPKISLISKHLHSDSNQSNYFQEQQMPKQKPEKLKSVIFKESLDPQKSEQTISEVQFFECARN